MDTPTPSTHTHTYRSTHKTRSITRRTYSNNVLWLTPQKLHFRLVGMHILRHYKSVHVSVFLNKISVSYMRIVPARLLEKEYTVIHAHKTRSITRQTYSNNVLWLTPQNLHLRLVGIHIVLHYKSVHVSVFLTYILVSYARIVPSSLLEKGYTVIHAPQRSVNFSKC